MAQTYRVGKRGTRVSYDGEVLSVKYHETEVVNADKKRIVLDTGGWRTMTTKTRMNQAANEYSLGYQVYQKDFRWFVSCKGKDIPFEGRQMVIPNGK